MKAMVLTGIRQMAIQDRPDPRIEKENHVLIRVNVVGICGSDVHYYTHGNIGSQVVSYPFSVGHEAAGTVEAVGSAVTRIRPGDRIAIEPAMPCWRCDQCTAGRPHTCRQLAFLGCPGQAEGCLCETIVMPETSCFKIPQTMSLEQAALSEPLAIGVYAVRQSIPMTDTAIGILGAGPIGWCTMLPARAQGARAIYITDRINDRVELAQNGPADWAGNPDREDIVTTILEKEPLGLDAVFECCGDQEALDQAVELLKPGGKLILVGIPALERVSFLIDKLRRKEIAIQNIRRQCHCVEPSLAMIQNGDFDVTPMVTHRFPLERTAEAFEMVADYRHGVLKAMVHINS